jgi:hypothetical protein
MPRMEDAAAESDSSNATLCNSSPRRRCRRHSCALDARRYLCSKDCQVHTAHRKRGGIAIKAVIDYLNAYTNTNVTE